LLYPYTAIYYGIGTYGNTLFRIYDKRYTADE
jgi:hypothetical protein